MEVSPRSLTNAEYKQGYVVCSCGKFAHILRAEVLRRLPPDYHGELCPDCSMQMTKLEFLQPASHSEP